MSVRHGQGEHSHIKREFSCNTKENDLEIFFFTLTISYVGVELFEM